MSLWEMSALGPCMFHDIRTYAAMALKHLSPTGLADIEDLYSITLTHTLTNFPVTTFKILMRLEPDPATQSRGSPVSASRDHAILFKDTFSCTSRANDKSINQVCT
jgi:hypothetical protein